MAAPNASTPKRSAPSASAPSMLDVREYERLKERLHRIVATPVHPVRDDKLAEIKDHYKTKHRKSFDLWERAKGIIPGGVQHNLSLEKPFPLTMDRAKGYNMWDIDGNEYVDYLMCGAPIILGHHYGPLDDRVVDLIREKGPATGCTSEYEVLAAEEIAKLMPGAEMVRFLQSGTEACMAALRVARVYTRKAKIIKIGGSYHGWSDQLVYSLHIPGTGPLEATGIPFECFANIIDVPPNDFDAARKAFEDAKDQGGVAAVIVEPVGGESGTHPVHPDWNRHLRKLCDEFGSLLIFDEVVTGFRVHLGGAQTLFDIKPDLTVLGKIVAHGYPSAGAIAGTKEVMTACSGTGSFDKAYLGGTLAANPISTAACYWALKLIQEHDAVGKATAAANKLTAALNDLYATRPDLPFVAYNYGPIVHYETTGFLHVNLQDPDALMQHMIRRKVAQDYQMIIISQGLFTLAGTRMYTCMQHDQASLDSTLKAWDYLLDLIPRE